MSFKAKSKLFKLLAPAKVNLKLKVLGRRPDGYHNLEMVMVPLDLADELEVERTDGGIEIRSDSTAVPVGRANILWKAAEALKERSGDDFGVRVFLRKKIPVAAGLGGGSSDAAALLKGINDAFTLGMDMPDLREMAGKLGADVPFFLMEGPQRVEGIGEKLTPIKLPPLWIVLVNPGFPVSTVDVYRWYDEAHRINSEANQNKNSSGIPKELMHSLAQEFIHGAKSASPLTTQKSDASLPPLENDLEAVVIPRYPVLAEIKEKLSQAGALGTLMSGSGPTVFGLFESPESRDRGYEILLKDKNPRWWVCKSSSLR